MLDVSRIPLSSLAAKMVLLYVLVVPHERMVVLVIKKNERNGKTYWPPLSPLSRVPLPPHTVEAVSMVLQRVPTSNCVVVHQEKVKKT